MSGEPKTLTPPWQYYRRKGLSEMRPYVPGEDLSGISVSEADRATMAEDARWGMVTGGYIARNPKNHADQWYVAQAYADKNLEPLSVVARDEAAELRAENDEADEPAPPEPNPLLLLADAVEETIGQAMWGQTLSGRPDLNGREKVMALLEQVRRLAGGENEK